MLWVKSGNVPKYIPLGMTGYQIWAERLSRDVKHFESRGSWKILEFKGNFFMDGNELLN